ncbi:heme exporter protein CcmD [Pararhodobacter sp. SW119]|uniref:heme exporter protein CcmD n=1 Tax=Pararhodobacter sp. SW119 TaxID=2780075 RepID=UPI001AE0D0C4|nr:heme exporter protein CcmD [Pararhodobacter sp. SW119]
MPDLGAYTVEVSLAYLGSLGLLGGLTLWVWLRGRRVRADLDLIENRSERNRHG